MAKQIKGITPKSVNISEWYNDVIVTAKLAEHGPVRGTMIIRPFGYKIWEAIQESLNTRIKDLGAENAYFPLFIPHTFLEKEKEHVQGFAPELAVVTYAGGEELAEPLVVRPTSETIIYDAFSRWISSYRDLPLVINQWSNVVRWEKRPYLFLRTTEFLWQEGHSAHKSQEEAQKMVMDALKMYVDFYQTELGLFGFAGKKSEAEKFAGAVASYSYEILMPDGKVVQACTAHDLGQNFSKVFNVKFQTERGQEELVYQTSWGLATRAIGAMILSHGDDNGLVLPPAVAPVQVIIIPIVVKSIESEAAFDFAQKVFEILESYDIRVRVDNREESAGWKFSQADLEGVPLRIEVGPKEVESQTLRVVRRDNKVSLQVSFEKLREEVEKLLEEMQKDLLEKSKQFTLENTREARTYPEFKEIMNTKKGFILAFWDEDQHCADIIQQETKATVRGLPLDSQSSQGVCIHCGRPAKYRWLFAQSY